MNDINSIIKKAQDELFPELEAKIRAALALKDKDWLIDQIIYLTCERHSLHEQKENLDQIRKCMARIQARGYTDQSLQNFIDRYRKIQREDMEKSGLLINPPHMGLSVITSAQRSAKGAALLEEAKDLLYVALYGDSSINVDLTRGQEELLTMIVPRAKSDALSFLKAVTEVNASGTWKDPEGVSNDDHADNIGLQVEFSDNDNGTIGTAVLVALNLINLLQVNEQILYARLEKIAKSSLQSL